MIMIGDTVKVISATMFNEDYVTFYPIGTVCTVVDIDKDDNAIGILPIGTSDRYPYYYLESELEKGHYEWIKN